MPNILDPRFKYVPAMQTDIRRTFARVRRELAKAGATDQQPTTPREDVRARGTGGISMRGDERERAHWILRAVAWWDRGGGDAVIFWMAAAAVALVVALL